MAHSIDHMLATLQVVMSEHQEALADHGMRQIRRCSPRLATQPDRRAALVFRLMSDVQRIAGIEISDTVAEKLTRVLGSVSVASLEGWVARLQDLPPDHPEWLSLIESLTVHETYLMRDRPQLEFFGMRVLPALIAEAEASGRRTLRLWSVGCASGEEAYSIAILTLEALHAAGKAIDSAEQGIVPLQPWRIDILGSDISRPALAQAAAGIYETGPLSAFRDIPAPLLRYFPRVPGSGAIEPARRRARHDLRSIVRFERFNIVQDTPCGDTCDAVLCRNVLIYFGGEARLRAQTSLCRAVRPGGYLLLGPTDMLQQTEEYETMWGPSSVIYRRRSMDHG